MAGTDVLSMPGLVASVSWVQRLHLSGMKRYTLGVGEGRVSEECRGRKGKKGGGKRKDKTYASFPIPVLFKKRTESLSRWWIWMRSNSYTRVLLNESSVNERKVLGVLNTA